MSRIGGFRRGIEPEEYQQPDQTASGRHNARMRPVVGFLVFAISIALLSGCAKDKIVGEWTFAQGPMSGTINFKGDKTYDMIMSGMGQSITLKGTYKVEGNTMKSTLTGFDAPGMDPGMKKTMEQGLEKEKGKESSGEIKWNGDDEFTTTMGTQSMTFTRKK